VQQRCKVANRQVLARGRFPRQICTCHQENPGEEEPSNMEGEDGENILGKRGKVMRGKKSAGIVQYEGGVVNVHTVLQGPRHK